MKQRSQWTTGLDHFDACEFGCNMQRGPSVVVGRVDLRSVLEKDLTVNRQFPSMSQRNECAIDLDHLDVFVNSVMQRSLSIVVGRVDIPSVLEEDLTADSLSQ